MDGEPDDNPTEETLNELITQLVKNGTLSPSDIHEMAGRLDVNGHEVAAHNVRCALIEAEFDPVADMAQRRRAMMQIVPDGGNRDN